MSELTSEGKANRERARITYEAHRQGLRQRSKECIVAAAHAVLGITPEIESEWGYFTVPGFDFKLGIDPMGREGQLLAFVFWNPEKLNESFKQRQELLPRWLGAPVTNWGDLHEIQDYIDRGIYVIGKMADQL